MIIYSPSGEVILNIPVDDNSYRYRTIRQGDKVYLYFSLTEHVEIPVYSYIEYQGMRYTLWRPEDLTKHGTRNLEYSVTFSGDWELLNRTKYKHLSAMPHKLKFELTGKPRFFLQLLVDNLNERDSGWTVGTCIEATEKTLAFSHEFCLEVLNRFADEWETEFEFAGKVINFGKVEYYKGDPFPLSYGRGNGFKTGVVRKNQGDKSPVSILYVQGGEKNIDPTIYGSDTLLLPKSQELEYEGRRYRTDEDGMYITRADRKLPNQNEDSYDASHIYPSRVGTVSEVVTVDASKNLYDFKDGSIPESLDYSVCRIAGEKATVIFQSGVMTGEEFDLEQTDKVLTGYVHAERRFKLVPAEKTGGVIPNENRKPAEGDTYAVFNISLPEAYVCDNETKSGASWEMFREAVRYLYEHEEETFTFSGELDGIWAKSRWLEIGGRMRPGSYILFSDPQFQPDGVSIRITGVKDYINKPHSPEVELSNTPVAGFVSSELGKIDSNEVKDEGRYEGAMHYTKRRWRDAIEAQEMLEKAFDDYSKGIDPIWVRTMSLLVGDESLQFRFVDSKTSPHTVDPDFIYDTDTEVFSAPKSILQHMTLGISDIKGEHNASEYKYWDLPAYTSPALGEFGGLYLYAKCSKSGSNGQFLLSETPHAMEEGSYYYFLVGLLGSQFDGTRSFVTVYGFTEILPGRITVDRIVSTDGKCYFNLGIGEIGGLIRFASGTTGYDNIKDKPDLSIYGTTAMLNAVKSDLQNQIDGKIETYYQSSNPWNSWTRGTEPDHVGDLWYNTSTRKLYRYVGPSSNTWERIYDQDAIDAAAAASQAQDTADGKRRVFLSTPYPPYDAGDQWITYGTNGSSMRICVRSRQSGSYVSTDWQLSDADGNVKVSIDRGVISAAGFLTFGGSAGMVGNGTIRIWSGGSSADNATFKVDSSGNVDSKGNIYITNPSGQKLAGFSGSGTSGDSIRIWAGNATPSSAPFRVAQNGSVYMSNLTATGGKIGSFEIINNRLVWEGLDYFGSTSRTIKLGYGNNNEGLVDVAFGASTNGRFGVKAVGRASGSAAIYGSSQSTQTYPDSGTVWAGWFDGYTYSRGYFARGAKGSTLGGLNGAYRIDDSDTWFVFAGGICVGVRKPRESDVTAEQ